MSALSHFIEGSSLVYTIFTLLYVGKGLKSVGRPRIVPTELIFPGILALYGLANVVVKRWDQGRYERLPYAIVGAALGLGLSLLGKSLRLPMILYGEKNQNKIHLVAMLAYALIFVFWIRNLNRYQDNPTVTIQKVFIL